MISLLRQTGMVILLVLGVSVHSPLPDRKQERLSQPPQRPRRASPSGGLDGVRTIYVIPMKDRLEHFLTNELVKWGHFEVTLNPRQADALLSDTTDVDIKQLDDNRR